MKKKAVTQTWSSPAKLMSATHGYRHTKGNNDDGEDGRRIKKTKVDEKPR